MRLGGAAPRPLSPVGAGGSLGSGAARCSNAHRRRGGSAPRLRINGLSENCEARPTTRCRRVRDYAFPTGAEIFRPQISTTHRANAHKTTGPATRRAAEKLEQTPHPIKPKGWPAHAANINHRCEAPEVLERRWKILSVHGLAWHTRMKEQTASPPSSSWIRPAE